MPCYHLIKAFQPADGGKLYFDKRYSYGLLTRELLLPCGQCIGCRLERSRQWAMRCMHEASLFEQNCFATFTYSDKFLPYRGLLDYPAFQKFMKRLRKGAPGTRFYMCGEYGGGNWRPHYHACLFNCNFADKRYWRTSDSGERLYRSDTLERLWPYGRVEFGTVTFESAAYVARYCVAKRTGASAADYYKRIDADGQYEMVPEFNRMSLKPGIGYGWLEKYKTDVYPHDYVIIRGQKCKPPKYYDRLFSEEKPEVFERIQYRREMDAATRYADNTPERLAVKEIVQRARANFLHRSL